MDNDQQTELARGVPRDGVEADSSPLTLNDKAMAILEHWRAVWTDLSRTDEVMAQGPSFVLWHSDTNGFESPGAFFSEEAIDQLIPSEEVRTGLRVLLETVDHARKMAVVLVLKDQGLTRAVLAVVPKTAVCKPQAWFEMSKIRKASVEDKVWITLRADSVLSEEGKYGYEGYLEEYFGVGSVMFGLEHREQIRQVGWDDLGSNSFTGGGATHYVWPERDVPMDDADTSLRPLCAKQCEVGQGKQLVSLRLPFTNMSLALSVQGTKPESVELNSTHTPPESAERPGPQKITTYYRAGEWASHYQGAVGTGLVIEQRFEGEAPTEWHLHQDFVISLGLQRQGDVWLRPTEGFQEVVRLVRDKRDRPARLEVRTEHLRDYLKARGMYLLMSSYRSRRQIVSDVSHITWVEEVMEEVKGEDKWEGVNRAIHEGGMPYGSSTGVFHASRTDIDEDDEVPVMGFPDDDSVVSKTWSIQHQGRKLYDIWGALWRTEVVEPGQVSERVQGEPPLARVDFAVNGSGERLNGDELEHCGRWLWFRPNVTALLASYRGSSLRWLTRDTGRIGISSGYSVHFGLNDLGLINVYAKDIGQLPLWQQRVWAGANLVPDGGVSAELLASQANAKPASSKAPEMLLRSLYDDLNASYRKLTGKQLFGTHHALDEIFQRIHRFRALEKTGVLELAKDLARVTVESLDGEALSVLAPTPKGMKAGSVKHLEATLQLALPLAQARELTKVLVGINELRQADAHLPSSEFANAFVLVGVNQETDPVLQGRQMLESLVESLAQMSEVISKIHRNGKAGSSNAV
ncbi:hypothetical protein [Pseudomonas syringae]|uniref:hypothetical protein n=1 Tax=Pseudomonas syringae TaxID=317 RepID=UPI000B027619|nr:hypothetical protein [Pseudomonas syringae]